MTGQLSEQQYWFSPEPFPIRANGAEAAERPTILLVTSSLLTDRQFLYTDLVSTLSLRNNVVIWAASRSSDRASGVWDDIDARVEPLPHVGPFREFPHNLMRRMNEFAWDYRYRIPSRMSMQRHVRDKTMQLPIRAMKLPARLISLVRGEQILENKLEKILLDYPRSEEAEQRLRELKPAAVVITGPFQFEQPGIFAAAKKLGIPTLAYIPSWDNVSTKNRMVFNYDGYIVWSDEIKRELHEFYPKTKNVPVYAVGAPQFDIFFQDRFFESRDEFCRRQQLDPSIPMIVYAVGSPNFLKEHHGAVELAKRVASGDLGKVQMLVRPHPIHDNAELREMFEKFAPSVRLQHTPDAGRALVQRSQDEDQIREWVNTFRHADVVVNLSSTVTVDAAIFDKPVVNLDFDPQPGAFDQQLINDVNHKWNHFKPVAESGGLWLVNNFEELEHAVRTYLLNPGLHKAKRRWIAEYVCGRLDGRCGIRMADAIENFAAAIAKDAAALRV